MELEFKLYPLIPYYREMISELYPEQKTYPGQGYAHKHGPKGERRPKKFRKKERNR